MPSGGRKKRKGFLEEYLPSETYLESPDAGLGKPGLLPGQAPDGRDVLIKVWPKPEGSDQEALKQIWRSEVRQLQRLAAIPGADELFVAMVASGEDDEGYYLVLDLRDGAPLETFRRVSNTQSIIHQPRIARNRRIIWQNALRLARALELLHAQGVIHRNIDPWAVVTALGDVPDFRLTGFEWSMRMAAMRAGETHASGRGRALAASFTQDWRNLGLLICDLIGAPAERVADLKLLPSEIATHLSPPEGRVLRLMIGAQPAERLDGQTIARQIEEVIAAIEADVAGKEMKSLLALRLGPDSELSEAIRKASDNEIEMQDTAAQLQFAADDLSDEPFLAREKGHGGAEYARTILLGRRLTYTLLPYKQPNSTTPANWEFALCDRAAPGRPPAGALAGFARIEPASVELHAAVEAQKIFPLRRGRVARWDERVSGFEPVESKKTDLQRKHQAFALLSILEMAYAAADIFPVEILPGSADKRGELHVLRIMPRPDALRADLSKALKIEPPALRLAKMLETDDVSGDTGWTLVSGGTLGDHDKDTEWRYIETDENSGVIQFEGPEQTTLFGRAFITPTGMVGQIAQFRRRVKALKALAIHTELLKMLVDPRRRIEKSHDAIIEDEAYEDLDVSKKAALTEILSTVPFFLLQGPPGVGKTFLVADIVRRRFDDEPASRLLLTAQSNAAIDHLMREVSGVFADVGKMIMIRARPAADDSDTDLEIDRQANNQLQALAESELVLEANPLIAAKVRNLAKAAASGSRRDRSGMAVETRAFESMILRAANLVFATTNSAAIESLIDESGFFDWSIVEEAGKATGGELLSPMLLSHRRLMIGDHKQLPPYGADRLEKLLTDSVGVRSAVSAAENLIERSLKDSAIEEIFDEVEDEQIDYGRLCAGSLEILNLFATLVDAELAPRPGKAPRAPIARRLDEQHRMHPAIAQIVSACFYGGSLRTNAKKEKEYRSKSAPFRFVGSAALPEKPVVFVDMPWGREQTGYKGGDRGPAWSNPDEAKAVIEVLKSVRAVDGASPSLAVLSPYRQQVKLISHDVTQSLPGQLAHLTTFHPAVGDEEFCGTVDSFQGDQADLVIISMVRNNGHASPAKALGFLRDNRRMNVLLSRAKWRVIIVGSLRFYESVANTAASLTDSDVGFLRIFLEQLKSLEVAGECAIVPWANLGLRS